MTIIMCISVYLYNELYTFSIKNGNAMKRKIKILADIKWFKWMKMEMNREWIIGEKRYVFWNLLYYNYKKRHKEGGVYDD